MLKLENTNFRNHHCPLNAYEQLVDRVIEPIQIGLLFPHIHTHVHTLTHMLETFKQLRERDNGVQKHWF